MVIGYGKLNFLNKTFVLRLLILIGGFSWSMAVFLDCPLGVVTASVHVLLKESASDV